MNEDIKKRIEAEILKFYQREDSLFDDPIVRLEKASVKGAEFMLSLVLEELESRDAVAFDIPPHGRSPSEWVYWIKKRFGVMK